MFRLDRRVLGTGGSDQDVRAAFKVQLRVRKPFSFTSPSILANRSRSKPDVRVSCMLMRFKKKKKSSNSL